MLYPSWIFTKYLETDFVNRIIKECNTLETNIAEVGSTQEDLRVDKKLRISEVAFLNRYKHKELYELIYNVGLEANNKAFGFDLNQLETIQFTKYNGHNKGKYDWHTDIDWFDIEFSQRKLSVVVQLSNPKNYKGGEFEIAKTNLDKKTKNNMKQQGSIIVFPSFLEHRIKPITDGTRLSLIGWIRGSKFK